MNNLLLEYWKGSWNKLLTWVQANPLCKSSFNPKDLDRFQEKLKSIDSSTKYKLNSFADTSHKKAADWDDGYDWGTSWEDSLKVLKTKDWEDPFLNKIRDLLYNWINQPDLDKVGLHKRDIDLSWFALDKEGLLYIIPWGKDWGKHATNPSPSAVRPSVPISITKTMGSGYYKTAYRVFSKTLETWVIIKSSWELYNRPFIKDLYEKNPNIFAEILFIDKVKNMFGQEYTIPYSQKSDELDPLGKKFQELKTLANTAGENMDAEIRDIKPANCGWEILSWNKIIKDESGKVIDLQEPVLSGKLKCFDFSV
jgi:hypothetical protein